MGSTFKELYEAVSLPVIEGRPSEEVTITVVAKDDTTTEFTLKAGEFEQTETLVLPPLPESPEEALMQQLQGPNGASVINGAVAELLGAFAAFYVNDPDKESYIETLDENGVPK